MKLIIGSGISMFAALFVFALVRVETPQTRQTAVMHEIKEAISYVAPEVSEETKIWALKRGYQLNGNSMVGPTIDLSNETPDSIVVKTEVIKPEPAPEPVVEKAVAKATACRRKSRRHCRRA